MTAEAARRGEAPPSLKGDRSDRRFLKSSGREAAPITARMHTRGLGSSLDDVLTGVDQLSKALSVLARESTGIHCFPDCAGQVVEAVERARIIDRARNLSCKHAFPFGW